MSQLLTDINFTAAPWNWTKGNNPLDTLLGEFAKCGDLWDVKKSRSYCHEYDLPCIVISDEEHSGREQDDLLDGYLGWYESVDGIAWQKEGRVVLFRLTIAKVAWKFTRTPEGKVFSFEEAFRALTTVVLVHEIGHWIHHHLALKGGCKHPLYCAFYGEEDTTVKEAIAQFVTCHSLKDDASAKALFEYLIKDAPVHNKYRGHEKLPALGIADLAGMIDHLGHYRHKSKPAIDLQALGKKDIADARNFGL